MYPLLSLCISVLTTYSVLKLEALAIRRDHLVLRYYINAPRCLPDLSHVVSDLQEICKKSHKRIRLGVKCHSMNPLVRIIHQNNNSMSLINNCHVLFCIATRTWIGTSQHNNPNRSLQIGPTGKVHST